MAKILQRSETQLHIIQMYIIATKYDVLNHNYDE